jgi:uncharacterized membrane protein YphA (DoxX/SURF4 family)
MEAAPRVAQNLTQIFARLIVCVVFLPAGAHALFGTERFTADEAQRIESLGSPAAPFEKMLDRKDTKPASMRSEPAPQPEPEDGTSFRALNRIALRLEAMKVPAPVTVAWAVAIVELVGAACVLLGFCTRLVAAPLALIGAFTLWSMVWPAIGARLPWNWTAGQSQMAAAWLAATLLPVTLLLQGAGAPSIDSLLSGKKKGGGKGGPKSAAPAA